MSTTCSSTGILRQNIGVRKSGPSDQHWVSLGLKYIYENYQLGVLNLQVIPTLDYLDLRGFLMGFGLSAFME